MHRPDRAIRDLGAGSKGCLRSGLRMSTGSHEGDWLMRGLGKCWGPGLLQ